MDKWSTACNETGNELKMEVKLGRGMQFCVVIEFPQVIHKVTSSLAFQENQKISPPNENCRYPGNVSVIQCYVHSQYRWQNITYVHMYIYGQWGSTVTAL